MVLHRNHHRDERRRRVLLEETGLGESETQGSKPDDAVRGSATVPKPYSDEALASHQPRVVDLIPIRVWSLVVLMLLVSAAAVGLEALYGYLALGEPIVTLQQVPAFDLAAPGNLAHSFAGGLLFLSAGLGCLICLMRRHRTDDYRGRYRMWYWVVPLLLLASVNQSADWGTSLRAVLLALAGIPDYSDAPLIWAAMATLLATVVLTRLVIEMRASRLAIVFAVAAWAAAGFVQAMQLGWVVDGGGAFQIMAAAGLRMLACAGLFLSLCLYARHVYLEVHGKLPAKAHKPAKAAAKPRSRRKSTESEEGKRAAKVEATKTDSAKSESTKSDAAKPARTAEPATASTAGAGASSPTASRLAGTKLRVDPPHAMSAGGESKAAPTSVASQPADAAKRRVSAPAVAEKTSSHTAPHPGPHDADDEDDGDDSQLSRAERRRLKKLQRRERRQG